MEEMCGCNELPIVPPQGNPADTVDVVGQGVIVVEESMIDGKKTFTVSYVAYTPPSIAATANPTREVGQAVDFSWNVTINQGRNPITSRSLTPQTDPVSDLTAPFVVSVDDATRLTRGTTTFHTVAASDGTTNVSKALAIAFYNKVGLLITHKDGVSAGQELTEADILASTLTLAASIKSVYGGVRTYVIPASAVPLYIYWIYEAGTEPITAMELSNLPFPIYQIPGSISVTNPHNGTIEIPYTLVRSANKFGTGSLSINML